MNSLNYCDTFIQAAEDCPAASAQVPQPFRGRRTVAMLHYDMLRQPYAYTQEEVLYQTEAIQKGYSAKQETERRAAFFSQPHACLRASPLVRQYGWGIHFDSRGFARLVAMESEEYRRLSQDGSLRQLKGMRGSRPEATASI